MRQLILLAPPKILLQHSIECWEQSIGNKAIIYSCASQEEALKHHFGSNFELCLYEKFNDNPLVELDVYKRAMLLTDPIIAALAEIDLERVARINDKLEVTQGSSQRMRFFRDKYEMKSLAKEKGARIPVMSRVRNSTELTCFVEQCGYPVVVKPCDGRGSNGVEVLRNEAQLRAYLLKAETTTFFNLMVEEFVQGDHYQINGLIINGEPVVISASKALVSCLDFLSGTVFGLQMVDPASSMAKKIRAYTEWLILEALPSENTFLFHLEIFITEDGEIILGEIAQRLGGCFVNEELKAAWGIDLRMSYLAALRDPKATIPTINKHDNLVGQLLVPPQEGTLLVAPKACDLEYVLNYKFTGSFLHKYTGMSFTNAEIMSAIVKGNTEAEVRSHLSALNQWFQSQSQWKTEKPHITDNKVNIL
ncbi:ATP-grasp domain-containing protein [Vibrio sp. D173a]|uniref:ATP-grasp domain-containing protein n=1 Tax=Vibrio sp. D173a TaxID=2836349 RepID=UPI002555BBE5|nr:ATP-grasp domain-containing protein [Vibrio sp. D173a]MDK9754025.1 ATP-grasp domain-containing protein [Vibrio sp. D173a]